MTLTAASINWAIDFVANQSDGDLFPRLPEIQALVERRSDFVALIENKPIGTFTPGACRRFIVPKDEISYRQATQLDPQDSVIFSALIYQFGASIEARRLPPNRVFSYRFQPSSADGLYGSPTTWNAFWTEAARRSQSCSHILYCDIADFYNQVYHHTVENQLIASGLPNQAIKWIITLLESTTAGVSRGVPIGPHPSHLVAEATLIPIDNSLEQTGLSFVRYADDIIIFCNCESAAKSALASTAAILDRQQRLMLQRHKTRFYTPAEFLAMCQQMIQDRPVSQSETEVLQIVRRYSGGNPYRAITYNQISPQDWQKFSEPTVRGIIEAYLSYPNVDYIRLRWFYRRLAQVGHPGAIAVSLEHLDKLGPCFANICLYLSSVQSVDESAWKAIGARLLNLLNQPEVTSNEYFRLSILSLFSRNSYINHFSVLAALYQSADPFVRREILLAAKANSATDWLRELKESFNLMDPWQRLAFLYGVADLPPDEKQFFINRFTYHRPFEIVLAKWSKDV